MKLRHFLWIMLLTMVVSSCHKQEKHDDGILIHNFSLSNVSNDKVDLSNVFTDYKLVPLETAKECMVGGYSYKVKKYKNSYYISSFNEILVFNADGKFVKKLSKCGSGPDEYNSLSDFDIAPDANEIWVAGLKMLYRYSLDSFELVGKTEFPFFINHFKHIGGDSFIAATTDDETYKICNTAGNVEQSYFKKDPALLVDQPVRFVKIDNIIACQLNSTNQAVTYNLDTKTFDIMQILPTDEALETMDCVKEAYAQYGDWDCWKKLNEKYVGIITCRKVDNTKVIILRYPNRNFGLAVCDGHTNKLYKYDLQQNCALNNDIAPSEMPIYNSIMNCDSDDSFLFLVGNDENSNPQILDVSKIAL